MTEPERLPEEILARFRTLPTSTVSDALDRLGLHGAVEGLVPIVQGKRIAGQAVTLFYLPKGLSGGTVGDFIGQARPGDVVVIDNRGRTDCTVWGNILTEVAQNKGLSATIIDGVNRDVTESRKFGYPIWSRAAHMLTGKDRVVLHAVNVPVTLGTVRVEAGDVICADDSGVVVVPLPEARAVLATAEEIETKEDAILADVRAGVDLAEARKRHGYFTLQTRQAS